MKKGYRLTLILLIFFSRSFAQDVLLFQTQEPLSIRATGSIKSIKKKSNDSTLVTGKFAYQQDTTWITVPVKSRVRGNFRLKNCYFPPLKIKFNKKEVASTVFAGNKSLKLVLPCRTASNKNELIRREYLCYRFYQTLSPYYFNTRLTNLELKETSRKKTRTYNVLAFFVEDNSLAAARNGAVVTKAKGINPAAFDEMQSIRNDYFQYMIGNADWSAVYQHNSNTLFVNGKFIPLSYDFDMSGFVNADYAHANPPSLGTGDPRERVYRGFCKSEGAMQKIRNEYLAKEKAIYAIVDEHQNHFEKHEVKDMHQYLDQFFEVLKNDNQFRQSILQGCRTQ